MDTSEQYIKMCAGAQRYLGVPKSFMAPYIDTERNVILEFPYLKNCTPLYTQDQLQRMVSIIRYSGENYTNTALNDNLNRWLYRKPNPYQWGVLELFSMEQLWLAFVMHELHNKKWMGNKWTTQN